MHVYYINLAHRTDRRAFMEGQFKKLGLEATRVEAVTPDQISPADLANHCDPRRIDWLTPPHLCCTLSHLEVMRLLLASPAPHALILEDDAVLSSRLPPLLDAFDATPPSLDVLRLETTQKWLRTKADGNPLAGIELARFVGWQGGTAAYIITRHGAEVILKHPRTKSRIIDQLFFHSAGPLTHALKVRQSVPGLAIQVQSLPSADRPQRLPSDLNMAKFERQQEAPYRFRHFLKRRWRAVHRDTVLAVHKAWFLYVEGARKHQVAFLP